jgi:hypothetical protein
MGVVASEKENVLLSLGLRISNELLWTIVSRLQRGLDFTESAAGGLASSQAGDRYQRKVVTMTIYNSYYNTAWSYD